MTSCLKHNTKVAEAIMLNQINPKIKPTIMQFNSSKVKSNAHKE